MRYDGVWKLLGKEGTAMSPLRKEGPTYFLAAHEAEELKAVNTGLVTCLAHELPLVALMWPTTRD